MKTKLLLTAVCSFFLLHSAFGQGALTPPGAPAPGMKTLAQIEPRTPISSVPFTISQPGSYYLTTNLTGVSGQNGITISNNNVTLDLNGFALTGVAGSSYGVVISGSWTNETIRNGSISGWGNSGADGYSFAGNSRSECWEHLSVSANSSFGIYAGNASVRDCLCFGNANVGIRCNIGEIRNCVSAQNGGAGIVLQNGDVRDCESHDNNFDGISVSPGFVTGCLVQNNGQSGILVNLPGSQVIGNNCIGNNTSGSTFGAGIYINDSNNRIEDNHVSASGYAGISVNSIYTHNFIIKNTVTGNGTNDYIYNTSQIVGPIITNTVSGIITNSNPWANFAF